MLGRPLRVDWRDGDTAEALQARYRAEGRRDVRPRLHALWLVRSGRTVGETAAALGVDYRSVQRWLAWYRTGGHAAVVSHRQAGKGQPSFLDAEQQAALVGELATGRFRTAAQIRVWVAEQWGVTYTEGGMYGLLARLGCSPKVPRPLHERADLAQQAAWKKGA